MRSGKEPDPKEKRKRGMGGGDQRRRQLRTRVAERVSHDRRRITIMTGTPGDIDESERRETLQIGPTGDEICDHAAVGSVYPDVVLPEWIFAVSPRKVLRRAMLMDDAHREEFRCDTGQFVGRPIDGPAGLFFGSGTSDQFPQRYRPDQHRKPEARRPSIAQERSKRGTSDLMGYAEAKTTVGLPQRVRMKTCVDAASAHFRIGHGVDGHRCRNERALDDVGLRNEREVRDGAAVNFRQKSHARPGGRIREFPLPEARVELLLVLTGKTATAQRENGLTVDDGGLAKPKAPLLRSVRHRPARVVRPGRR